ncbi:MAG: hypothetical protein AB1638_07645 [Nitrospirota bacterium]
MKKLNLNEKLCRHFCPYYKPTKDNRLACRGFIVVERLIREERKISFEKSDKILDMKTKETLVRHVCLQCPFYRDDCDFISGKEKSFPCGGFILLGHLLETNIIDIDDIG